MTGNIDFFYKKIIQIINPQYKKNNQRKSLNKYKMKILRKKIKYVI